MSDTPTDFETEMTNRCRICEEFTSDSRIDIRKHISTEHTTKEKLDTLVERVEVVGWETDE